MSFTLDPQIAYALAPMAQAMSDAVPAPVGDVHSRRPVIGAPHEFDTFAFDSDVAKRSMADRLRMLTSL